MNCFDVYYVHGMDYAYAVIGTRVFRMSEEQCSMICDLTDALKGGREMFVSADDMVQFYNSVLRKASAYVPVNGDGVNLEQFTVPTLGCKIYLKCEDKCVFAEVKACYGEEEFDILNDGFVTGHLRDWDSEDDIRTLLNKYFPQYPELVLSEESDIFEFLKRGVRELASYAEIFMSESMSKYRLRPVGKVRVGVRLHSDILSVAPGRRRPYRRGNEENSRRVQKQTTLRAAGRRDSSISTTVRSKSSAKFWKTQRHRTTAISLFRPITPRLSAKNLKKTA